MKDQRTLSFLVSRIEHLSTRLYRQVEENKRLAEKLEEVREPITFTLREMPDRINVNGHLLSIIQRLIDKHSDIESISVSSATATALFGTNVVDMILNRFYFNGFPVIIDDTMGLGKITVMLTDGSAVLGCLGKCCVPADGMSI